MKWSEQYIVDSHDLDFNGIAKTSSLIRYMQECANAQCRTLGPSNEKLREDGFAFLLSRFSAGLYAPVYAYEKLTVESWGVESRGFSFNRCYRILRGEEVVAEATSVWALVDISSRHPIKVSEYHPNFTYDPMLTLDGPARITFPSGVSLRLVGEHTVTYGETDQNMHMNNTKYPDMLCSQLDMKGKRIYRISMNFMNEAPLGETVNVYSLHHNESDLFRTIRADGKTNIEAQVILGDI